MRNPSHPRVHRHVPSRSAGASGTKAEVQARLRALRHDASPPAAGPTQLVIATIRVRIPPRVWLSGFSRRHPSLRIEVMNRTEVTPDVSVSDYWVGGGGTGGSLVAEIATHADVLRVEGLADLGEGCVYRVTYENPPIVAIYRELGIPIQFPLRIQDGSIWWEVAARDSDFRRIMRYVHSADPTAQILSIRRRPLRSHLPELTVNQRALLSTAMAEGYFAVPRSITLTALAKKLGRSKSSISESLALIEQKILEVAARPPLSLATR